MARKRESNNLASFFVNLANVGCAEFIRLAMASWKDNGNILEASPAEHLLSQMLGVDVSWVRYFDGVLSGKLHGPMLVGAEDHPATELAQALMVQRYGAIQHPYMNTHSVIHPRAKQEIEKFSNKKFK